MPTLTARTETILKTGNLLRKSCTANDACKTGRCSSKAKGKRAEEARSPPFLENEHVDEQRGRQRTGPKHLVNGNRDVVGISGKGVGGMTRDSEEEGRMVMVVAEKQDGGEVRFFDYDNGSRKVGQNGASEE